jgi:hypothetical protein
MPAYPRRWRKTSDEPSEERWELPPYPTEIVSPVADDGPEVREQLRHAREQLELARRYPGRRPTD